MRFANLAYVFGIVAALAANSALAQDRGTPEQAKALVEKAAAHMKEVGPEKACADFTDPKGGYVDRDLFVFVYGPDVKQPDVKIACAAGIPALIGRDALALKDVDGKEFAKLIIAAAEAGGGWTEYRMTNPATKKVEPKKTYSAKVGDRVLGVGAYNP